MSRQACNPLSLESTLRVQGINTVELQPVWSFTAEHPELREALAETEPWLAPALETLAIRLPLPETVGAFVARPFYRPPGSYRCFYYCPSSLHDEGSGRSAGGRAVVAIKGLEPCTRDVNVVLRDLKRACYSPHNIAEHLIFEERKIPASLGLAEALREAKRAAEIQSAHVRVYGSLARLPFPLFVFRHSVEVERQILEMLRRELSDDALETVEPWVACGLGVYVYYYPTAPVRARDIDLLLQGLGFQQRMFALIGLCDPEEVIRRWVCLFVRMLYLGVLPGTLPSFRTGICCQPQNACIDGGFVDLDSLTPLIALRDDTAVYAALQFSTDSLLNTVRALVAGSTDSMRPEGLEGRFDLHHLNLYVLALIQDGILNEARQELGLDIRISRYYTSARSFEGLVNRVSPYYSPLNPDFAEAARRFNDFGLSLIAAARGV